MRALRLPLSIQFPSLSGALLRSTPPLAPERPIYAVGDIHGRADLLVRLLRSIREDAERHQMGRFQLVFLGDYVDRGFGSSRVVGMLHRLSARNPSWVTCLMGNHERMMLDFLADPEVAGPLWLRNGGRWTLESYRIALTEAATETADFIGLARALVRAMPAGTRKWLSELPLYWQSGNVACVHAGTDPLAPIEQQSADALLWGHRDFPNVRRKDALWVVHGHTIVATPRIGDGRISIDTGAYATGHLSAVAITPEGRTRIIST